MLFAFAFVLAALGVATRQLFDELQRQRRRQRQQGRNQSNDWLGWALLGTATAALIVQAIALLVFGAAGLIFAVSFAVGYAWREIVAARAFPKIAIALTTAAVWLLVPSLRAPLASLALLCGILYFLVRGTLFPAKKKS